MQDNKEAQNPSVITFYCLVMGSVLKITFCKCHKVAVDLYYNTREKTMCFLDAHSSLCVLLH